MFNFYLKKNPWLINPDKINTARRDIPKSDFVDENFDGNFGGNLKHIIFLLSSPRSGSTLLSNAFFEMGLCLPHEYFQKWQYVPLLADRWSCISKNCLDGKKYVNSLIKYRTSPNGFLGVNLHGHHLSYFISFEKFFPDVPKSFVFLRRKNLIAQSISYVIASQTNSWTANFEATNSPQYSYGKIADSLEKIKNINKSIENFLKARAFDYYEIFYEDVVVEPVTTVEKFLTEMGLEKIERFPPRTNTTKGIVMKKQSSGLNLEWETCFYKEYISN